MKLNYLTVDEVKLITRMSNESIRKHIRLGNLKVTKIGARYLIQECDLIDFMNARVKKGL